MAYPGETSRTAKTTAGGVAYTDIAVTHPVTGDKLRIAAPDGLADGAHSTLVIMAHGASRTETYIDATEVAPSRDAFLDKGWIVTTALAGGNAWGNQTALDRYRDVYDWVNDVWPVVHTLLHGASMGGLTVVNALGKNNIPRVRATASIDGAVNLRAAYDSTNYKDSITPAYNIAADGSDYDAKTAGHDPSAVDPALFTGKKIFLSASPGDIWIPKTDHSDVFNARVSSLATVTYQAGTGGHVSAANYFPTDVTNFFTAAIPATPPEGYPATQATAGALKLWTGSGWGSVSVTMWNGSSWAPTTLVG